MDYDEYRKLYIKQHRSSAPSRGTQAWGRAIAMALFIASAIVSGAHTIPAISETLNFSPDLIGLQYLIAFVSLFMVEIALFGTAFARRMRLLDQVWLLYGIQFIALMVGISGNLYSTFKTLGILDNLESLNGFTVFLGVSLGFGAPLSTMLSGDLAAGTELKYQESWIDFEKKILAAFKKDQKASARVRKMSGADGQQRHTTGYERMTDAREIVRVHLVQYPEDMGKSVRVLAEELGVGKTTVSDVRREIQSLTGNTNGHTPQE